MIAVLKYSGGNILSVTNAINRLGFRCSVTDSADDLKRARKIIIPGVGEAGSAMEYLRGKKLDSVIPSLSQPVLGICLGLQLMCRFSEEGSTRCLGIFDADVKKLPPADKVPHMGWNNFMSLEGPLFKGIKAEDNVYYVHSYYAEINDFTNAVCDYILPFSAAINRANFYGVQFHPEKSADTGFKILKNFLEL